MTDYLHLKMKTSDTILSFLAGVILVGVCGFLFFRSVPICLPLSAAGGMVMVRSRRSRILHQTRQQLIHEFRECLGFMMTLIRSGRSAEGMIIALSDDLDPMAFPILFEEIAFMKKGVEHHRNVEELFEDLGRRSGCTDIRDFAGILSAGKRTRGNLEEIMQHSIRILEEKLEAQEEMAVLLSGKKLEQNILNVTPFLLLLLLNMMNPGYLEPLYSTSLGQVILILCMLLMIGSFYWSGRIMKIEI